MDVYFQLHDITFTWDNEKAQQNARKHNIHFEQAAEAFFDPFLKIIDASRHHEERDAIIGMDRRWQLLFVVHTEIVEDRIRLISAREATHQERLYYENG